MGNYYFNTSLAMHHKGVFTVLSSIYDEAFPKKSLKVKRGKQFLQESLIIGVSQGPEYALAPSITAIALKPNYD